MRFLFTDAGQPGTEIFNMPASTTAGKMEINYHGIFTVRGGLVLLPTTMLLYNMLRVVLVFLGFLHRRLC